MTTDPARTSAEAQAFLTTLRARRSIRHFQPRTVPREIIEQLLEAAIWAPSANNLQPWRFVVFQGERKHELAAHLRQFTDGLQPGLNPVLWVHRAGLRRCAEMIDNAAVAITAWTAATPDDARVRLIARGDLTPLFTWTMVVQSVAAAVENLLLATHALGLGAVWMGYPNLASSHLKDWLKEDGELMATIALGYPAQEAGAGKRKALADVVRWEG